MNTHNTKTWKDVNAIYQIYPRSFQDSNGDGVGDLRGIIQRLPYLKGEADSLGVDAVWFSPFFPSPMADFGYDVSDYCNIDPLFGSLDDFKELIAKAHERDIKVMIDFVPNHSSDQHPWFQESKSSRDNPKRDYYVWRDAKPDGSPPNNWMSIFGGPAWEWDETTGQYYLHTFLKEQPDWNWENPDVRREMQRILRFWFDMGVDGIRADAVRWISKDEHLRDDPKNPAFVEGPSADPYWSLLHVHSRFGPKLFSYLRELTDVVAQYENRIMVFEDYPDSVFTTRDQYLGFYGIRPEVSMPFNFEGIGREFSASSFRNFITEFQGFLDPARHTPVYCFGNHDQPRLVSRVGERQARLLAVLQATLPGLPVIYYGDELGMKNGIIRPEQEKDPVNLIKPGLNQGRDPERTPMQWDASKFAGFSTATPWLPTAGQHEKVNVAVLSQKNTSFLQLYKKLFALRGSSNALARGSYETLDRENPHIFSFVRIFENEQAVIALNFSNRSRSYKIPPGYSVAISSVLTRPKRTVTGQLKLRPYEAVVLLAAS